MLFPLAIFSGNIFAHHPAEDMVDAEINAMIDEMVSQTPHDTMIEEMMTALEKTDSEEPEILVTKILTNSMGAAESLINRGLISFVSMLTGETSITIQYGSDKTESEFKNSSP